MTRSYQDFTEADTHELHRDLAVSSSARGVIQHPTKLDKLDLCTRRLRRPIDGPTRAAIASKYSRRRHEIPVPTELQWLFFVVRFTHEMLAADAELALAAKAFATQTHRQDAVRFIDSIVNDLGL